MGGITILAEDALRRDSARAKGLEAPEGLEAAEDTETGEDAETAEDTRASDEAGAERAHEAVGRRDAELLGTRIQAFAAHIAESTCELLLLVAEFDRREALRWYVGLTSVAHWLAWACSTSPAPTAIPLHGTGPAMTGTSWWCTWTRRPSHGARLR